MDELKKKYFEILEPDFPEWLNEYINTEQMQRLKYVSVTCGKKYTKLFDLKYDFSTLDHSISVALIIWHFTKDRKQTLSGLFHDISTPVFKHCVDFLNGDYMTQESTESLTKSIIANSQDIMKLLKRDGIDIDEVCDYHIYPIADNDTPQLSADRLEYSMSNDLFVFGKSNIEDVRKIYDDIVVGKNESGIVELEFKSIEIAINFVKMTSRLSVCYRDDETRYSMQFIADIMKKLNEDNMVSKKDLYYMKEAEIIKIIEDSKYGWIFEIWKNATQILTSSDEPKDVYYVHHGAKIRYIDPLVRGKRTSEISDIAQNLINDNLKYDMSKYVYINDII